MSEHGCIHSEARRRSQKSLHELIDLLWPASQDMCTQGRHVLGRFEYAPSKWCSLRRLHGAGSGYKSNGALVLLHPVAAVLQHVHLRLWHLQDVQPCGSGLSRRDTCREPHLAGLPCASRIQGTGRPAKRRGQCACSTSLSMPRSRPTPRAASLSAHSTRVGISTL